ncbi:MAG: hypothetical protein KAT90_03240 [Gammaproteobacteria bacterium]|nr:hypothetical protein [Gammaproteobacteria bacterium]
MKNFKLKRLLSLAFIGCLSTLNATTVFAAAGDPIANRATLSFDVGTTSFTLESSDVGNTTLGLNGGGDTSFVEDRLINFAVAEVGGTTTSLGVVANATLRVQEFTVTNNGNAPQDFLLAALNHANGVTEPHTASLDAFDVTASVFVDDGVAGYILLDDTDIFIDELAAGASRTVYIVSTIPGTATNGQVAVTTLVAQIAAGGAPSADDSVAANAGAAIMNDNNGHASPAGTFNNGATTTVVTGAVALAAANVVDDPTVVEAVFNDPAGAFVIDVSTDGAAAGISGAVQDVVQNGQHSDSDSYTVGAAILTVTKTSETIWDPVNGALANDPKAITGAYTQYTITVANDALAGASGDLTSLGDTLVGTTLDPNLLITTAGLPIVGPGDYEGGAGTAFRIDTSGTGRNAALNASTSSTNYCTGDVADADADGCSSAIAIDFTALESMDAEAGYTAGELKPNESVVIVFNVIIP